jgi:hypothetical protein
MENFVYVLDVFNLVVLAASNQLARMSLSTHRFDSTTAWEKKVFRTKDFFLVARSQHLKWPSQELVTKPCELLECLITHGHTSPYPSPARRVRCRFGGLRWAVNNDGHRPDHLGRR